MKVPDSVFSRTTFLLVITYLLLLIVTITSIAYFILFPVARRSAEDLAALIVLSGQTWVELPPQVRPDLAAELMENHALKVTAELFELHDRAFTPPYIQFLDDALRRRTHDSYRLGVSSNYDGWHWVDLPQAGQQLRFGFHESRLNANPSKAIFTIAFLLMALCVVSALLLSHSLTWPLRRFSAAISSLGRGEKTQLRETGPAEIKLLTHKFNDMSDEVVRLLNNRTVMLAGISHDLRTPMTRMQLALAMMPEIGDNEMSQEVFSSLADMEKLIADTMQIAREIDQQEPALDCDLAKLVSEVVASQCHHNVAINWHPSMNIVIPLPRSSLMRVLTNLLENAILYGGGEPVSVGQSGTPERPVISIIDRGPGIPRDQLDAVFQPFFRLEGSRAVTTGGSGIGLAIVQQICNANSWQVSLTPGEDGGTIATLAL